MLGTYHMGALLDALSDIHHVRDQANLYAFALNRCSEILKAQGGTFYNVREALGELYPEASKGVSLSLLREIPFKMKTGIAGWVATNRRPALVENAQTDERFNRAVDVITGIRTRSLICVPILRQDKLMAVVEMVNRIDGVFRDPDLEFFQHMCNQVGVALENCQLYKETEDLLAYTNSVINSLTGGFISTDAKGFITRCNAAACRILGISAVDVMGKTLLNALHQYPAFGAIVEVTQKNQAPVARLEIELQRPDGSALELGYSTFLIRNDLSQNLGVGIVFQDLTYLKH
jgi:PAS domain S-box-containing protein